MVVREALGGEIITSGEFDEMGLLGGWGVYLKELHVSAVDLLISILWFRMCCSVFY